MYNNNLEFFNINDGESKVIRILSSTVDKMEVKKIHIIPVDGKKKSIMCLDKNCPLCSAGNEPNNRLYVHLYDYTDNKEKVWSRTTNPKFMNMLREIEAAWENLNTCPIKLTRGGGDFPSYEASVQPPTKYAMPDLGDGAVDAQVAYRFALYRSSDELNKYIETGVLPPHVKKQQNNNQKWLPKEEYYKQKKAAEEAKAHEAAVQNYENAHMNNLKNATNKLSDFVMEDDENLPF